MKQTKRLVRTGKRLAKQAARSIGKEFSRVAKKQGFTKKEAKRVGRALAAEAKREGTKIGAFLAAEFKNEMAKAGRALQKYARKRR